MTIETQDIHHSYTKEQGHVRSIVYRDGGYKEGREGRGVSVGVFSPGYQEHS
jgi:hypothetical protein